MSHAALYSAGGGLFHVTGSTPDAVREKVERLFRSIETSNTPAGDPVMYRRLMREYAHVREGGE